MPVSTRRSKKRRETADADEEQQPILLPPFALVVVFLSVSLLSFVPLPLVPPTDATPSTMAASFRADVERDIERGGLSAPYLATARLMTRALRRHYGNAAASSTALSVALVCRDASLLDMRIAHRLALLAARQFPSMLWFNSSSGGSQSSSLVDKVERALVLAPTRPLLVVVDETLIEGDAGDALRALDPLSPLLDDTNAPPRAASFTLLLLLRATRDASAHFAPWRVNQPPLGALDVALRAALGEDRLAQRIRTRIACWPEEEDEEEAEEEQG